MNARQRRAARREGESPKGFKAVPSEAGCSGCYFRTGRTLGSCSARRCAPFERKDGQDVIFVKK